MFIHLQDGGMWLTLIKYREFQNVPLAILNRILISLGIFVYREDRLPLSIIFRVVSLCSLENKFVLLVVTI